MLPVALVVHMMGSDRQLFEDVLGMVDYWVPAKDHNRKTGFRDELEQFLRRELNQPSNNPVALNLGQRKYDVQNTRSKADANITVDDVVGIELVHNFSKQDRADYADRIENYSGGLPYLIICACGVDDRSGWDRLSSEYGGRSGVHIGLGDDREIAFVDKRRENYGRDPNDVHGGDGLLGGLL